MSLRDFDKNTMILSRKNMTTYDRNTFTDDKDKCRKILESDIEAFLKSGGKITVLEPDESSYPDKIEKRLFVPNNYKDAKI